MKVFEITNSAPSAKEVKSFALAMWNKIKDQIHVLFDEGNPTCLYSTGVIANSLRHKGWNFYIASGELNNSGHWWIVVQTSEGDLVVDLGDNTCPISLDTGTINPKIVPLENSDYNIEDKLSYEQFKQYIGK